MLNRFFKTDMIRAIDQYTIEHEPISSLDLMERAAGEWTKKFLRMFQGCREVIIVAGRGNNGGDGYVIARLLSVHSVRVIVYQLQTGDAMSRDCEANCRRWMERGGNVREVKQITDFEIHEGAIVIDAIFGSGLNRKVTGLAGEVIRQINISGNMIVAVDMPSGLMGEDNSANDPDTIIRADFTYTFQFPKLAFMLPENSSYVGEWQVLDVGLHPDIISQAPTDWYYTTADDLRGRLPRPEKFAHKGMNGRGLLIAGSYGMMGAAVLAARSAVRSGIGVLYCHVPGRCGDILQTTVPEAILDPDPSDERFSAVADLGRFNAVALGPAIGQGPETVEAVKKLLQDWRGITILDADALNILSDHREMLELLHDRCILTPHLKEFERLAGKSENDFDRLNKLSIFANQYHTYVVLKGAYSVVATPEGRFYFNMSGNSGMAKGGAGDVLTGVLLGLAAQGMGVLDIARIGVYAHGVAGDLLAAEYGFRGISSGMLAEAMSKAWRELEG